YYTDHDPGQLGPEGPIQTAGFTALRIADITSVDLGALSILLRDEQDNGSVSFELGSRLPHIEDWVNQGRRLIVPCRRGGNLSPKRFVVGLPGAPTIRSETANVDVIPPGDSVVILGPFGTIDNATLDGGNSSAHGYISSFSLPPDSIPILSIGGNPDQVVDFSYPLGSGLVYYSAIPLDCYLVGGGCGCSPCATMLQTVYLPNVLVYVATGPTSDGPPAIVSQPHDRAVLEGVDTALRVGAVGARPLQYQWRREGTNVAGATNSALLFQSVQ